MEIELEAILCVRDGRLHDLNGLTAQLWDEDMASDDLLAEGVVSGKVSRFHATFRFDSRRAASADSIGEKCPDLYVVVRNGQGSEWFRSAVLRNTDLYGLAGSGKPIRLEFVEA